MSEADRGLKRFSGEDDDAGKALRRWKTWAQAKMMTMKDLKPNQKGPWLLTLLDARAWDCCEHLTLDQLAVDGGDSLLWQALEARFPEKEEQDLMGEALGEAFGLVAADQETMKGWTARVQEVFEKCKRRASVDFPQAARGWIALNCCGLTEEQKAIVKAKTNGSLEFSEVSKALRSCFPVYKATSQRKKTIGGLPSRTRTFSRWRHSWRSVDKM